MAVKRREKKRERRGEKVLDRQGVGWRKTASNKTDRAALVMAVAGKREHTTAKNKEDLSNTDRKTNTFRK